MEIKKHTKSLEGLTKEQKNQECFWWEKPRTGLTRGGDPAHITEKVYPDESPSGNECETSVAYCGQEMLGYSIGGGTHLFGDLKEVINENLPICEKCLELYLGKLGTSDSFPDDNEPYNGSLVYTKGMIRRGEDPYHDGNVDEYGNANH